MAACRLRVAAESGEPIGTVVQVDDVVGVWGKYYNIALERHEEQGEGSAWTFSVTEQKPGALEKFFQKAENGPMICRGQKLVATPVISAAAGSLVFAAFSSGAGQGIDPAALCEMAEGLFALKLTPRPELGLFVFATDNEAAALQSSLDIEDPSGKEVTATFKAFAPSRSTESCRLPGEAGSTFLPSSVREETVCRIEVFQDGENCPVPQAEFVCDASGTWILQEDKRPQLQEGPPHPIHFEKLYELVLRRVVECVEGPQAAASKDLNALDVKWHFVLCPDKPTRWHPHQKVKDDMIVKGVTCVDPGSKQGAVDRKMKELLNHADLHWRNKAQEEKDGLVLVVISGDSDFAEEVRQLAKTKWINGANVPGMQVVVLFSKNAPAKRAYTPTNMISDCYGELVEMSRMSVQPLDALGQDQKLVHSIQLKRPKLRFLFNMPDVLRSLQARMGEVHPSFSLLLPKPPKPFDNPVVRIVQEMKGKLASKDASEDDRARVKELVTKSMDNIVVSDAITVLGITPNELAQDEPLKFLGNKHSIEVFIPNVKGQAKPTGQAPAIELKATELLVETAWTEEQVKSYALEKLQATIFQMRQVRGLALIVLDLGSHRGKNLDATKTRLLRHRSPLISFRSSPQQTVELQMKHPVAWKQPEVMAFMERNELTFTFQPEAKVYTNYASRRVTCSSEAYARIKAVSEEVVSFKIWEEKGLKPRQEQEQPNEEHVEAMAILVHLRENERGTQEIVDYLKSRAVETRLVKLVSSEDPEDQKAELELMRRQWPSTEKQLKGFDVHDISRKGGEVQFKGKVDAVQAAQDWLEKRVGSVKVLPSPKMSTDSKKHWLKSTTRFLSATINDAARLLQRAVCASSIEGAAGPAEEAADAGFVAFAVDKTGVARLAFFPEDEDLAKELLEELGNFQKQYLEEYWRAPEGSTIDLWKLDIGKLQKNFQLSHAEWEQSWLLLCGDAERVKATAQHLTDLCQPEPCVTDELCSHHYVSYLLRKQPQAWQQLKQIDERGVKATPLPKGDVLLRLSGPGPAVQQAKQRAERLLREFEGKIQSRRLRLTAGQMDYLREDPEGKHFRSLINQVWVEDAVATQGKLLAMFRLPNGANLEVRQGDAVAGGLGIDAIVNSANENLLRGGVAGIAGAIKARGGPGLEQECEAILRKRAPAGVAVGEVVATNAHELGSVGFSRVLHAVPPVYHGRPGEEQQMQSTVRRILAEAEQLKNVGSVVMPVLGTGIFGWMQDLDAVLTQHLRAIAHWGSSAPKAVKRIVIMDKNPALVQALHLKLSNFEEAVDDRLLQERPELLIPPPPRHLWFYWKGANWVPYDYDQALQLDDAQKKGLQVVRILGDRNGRPSDSTNIEEGEEHATYNVDFTKGGEGFCAVQVNRKSGFERQVRKAPLQNLEEALEKVPLYRDRYDATKRSWSEAVADWDAKHSAAGQAVRPKDPLQTRRPGPQQRQAAARSASKTKRPFLLVESEPEELVLMGLGAAPENAERQLLEKLASAEVSSQQLALALDGKETAQDALADFGAFLARRDLVHVKAQLLKGCVVLSALGKMNLLKGEKEFEAWQRDRAQTALQDEAKRNRVRYPSDSWFKWDPVSEEKATAPGAEFYTVNPDSEEWKNVEKLMRDETGLGTRKGLWRKTMTKVERIQNPLLWKAFQLTCRRLEGQAWNNGSANLLWAKHGTGKTDPREICQQADGLDKNFSSTGMFGKAVYVAENACYSDDRTYCYDCWDADGTPRRQILLCQIAAGKIKDETYSDTTRKFVRAPEGHDSVRGDVVPTQDFFALMLYRDYQVYPAYLVTFKP